MNIKTSTLSRWLLDYLPALAWMALIFMLSHRSVLITIESQAGEKTVYKSAHVIAYAVLAWLWWRVLSPRRETTWPLLLAAWLLTILYGISDEVHQRFIPGRNGQIADVLFDASGGLAMILLLRRFRWLRQFPETFFSSTRVRKFTEFVRIDRCL